MIIDIASLKVLIAKLEYNESKEKELMEECVLYNINQDC